MPHSYFAETLAAEKISLVRRTHKFDRQIFNQVNNNRNFLRPWLPWVEQTQNLADVAASPDLFIDQWQKQKNYCYIIFDRKNNLIGSIDFHNIDYSQGTGEIGYWLSEQACGQGYAGTALQLLESEIFKHCFSRIFILCDNNNHKSINLALRQGYRLQHSIENVKKPEDLTFTRNIYVKVR